MLKVHQKGVKLIEDDELHSTVQVPQTQQTNFKTLCLPDHDGLEETKLPNQKKNNTNTNLFSDVWSRVSTLFAANNEPLSEAVELPQQQQQEVVEARRACTCGFDKDMPYVCIKARQWHKLRSRRDLKVDYKKMKQTFKSLCSLPIDKESEAQIERDLGRTFPRHPFF